MAKDVQRARDGDFLLLSSRVAKDGGPVNFEGGIFPVIPMPAGLQRRRPSQPARGSPVLRNRKR